MRKKNLCQEIKTIDAANVIHENDNILEQTLVQRSKNENFTVNRFNLTLLWLLIFLQSRFFFSPKSVICYILRKLESEKFFNCPFLGYG